MSKRTRNFRLPLKNIANFNTGNMGYSDSIDFSSLTSSPMSNLAFNLSELSTGRSTPRRRLSLTVGDLPSDNGGRSDSERSLSMESDSASWSPEEDSSPLDSVFSSSTSGGPSLGFDNTITFDNEKSVSGDGRSLSLDDACSQDSGLGFEHDRRCSVQSFDDGSISSSSSLSHLDRLPSLEDVWNTLDSPGFKAPKGMPPRRTRSLLEKQFSEDTCSPIKYSPVKFSSLPRPSFSESLFFAQIPQVINETSETRKSEAGDGFQELFKLDHLKNEADDQLSSLINATLLHQPCYDKSDELAIEGTADKVFNLHGDTPSGRLTVARRGLQRSQSLDIRCRPSTKRCDPPIDSAIPVQNKKWRGDNENSANNFDDDTDDILDNVVLGPRYMHRCHSETEATIKFAISRMYSQPDLIGDCSKTYCLPTITGRHQDLKSISPETLSQLMGDEFSDNVEEFHIIDCRYPYEFEGGHIQNAVNIYTKEKVMEKFMKSPLRVKDPKKRMILVFHCEFSSERGPGLYRFLRRQDRETNKEQYPFLHYPEIYLLEGGYKHFFEQYSHLCEPREYKTMFDKNHSDDLRKFRAKCKSWTDDKAQSRTGVRNLKF